MVADPVATPVTTPEAFTVATAVLLEDQVPPVVASFKPAVDPMQTSVGPVIGATASKALTVTEIVALEVQPLALVTV
jgi:hypothetical protein